MDPVEKNAAREFHINPARGRRGRRVLVAIAALVILGLIGLIAPRPAHANYFVKECTPSAQPYATDPYTIGAGIYRISYSNECGTGSGYGLRLDAHGTSGPWGRLVWQVGAPGGTVFKTADVDVHYGNDDGYGPAMATAAGGYLPLNGGNGPNQWAHSSLSNTDHFGIWLMCWRTGQSCTSNKAYAWSTNVLVEVDDLVAPQITASGEILDGGTVRGVQAVQAAATDAGGGVRSVTVYVNGVASKVDAICVPFVAGGSYDRVKPCADSPGPRTLLLDTQNDPGWVNGPNDLRICSTDAGGNQSTPCLRRLVDVDNSCPASGSQPAARLDAGADVGGRLRAQASVRSTDAPVIRGALATSSGRPVAGATVCVYQTIALADASRELVTMATTQPNGRFATKLEPGASRTVDARVSLQHPRPLSSRCGLIPRWCPSLSVGEKSVANGHPVHFRGGSARTKRGWPGGGLAGPGRSQVAYLQAAAHRPGRPVQRPVSLHTDNRPRGLCLPRSRQTAERLPVRGWSIAKAQGCRARLGFRSRPFPVSEAGR